MGSTTVPMFSPDGTLGDVPYEKSHEALGNGFKMGVNVMSQDGQHGTIPADKLQAAQAKGMKPVPYDVAAPNQGPQPGVAQTVVNDTLGRFQSQPGESVADSVKRGVMGTGSAEAVDAQKQKDVASGNTSGVVGHTIADAIPAVMGGLPAAEAGVAPTAALTGSGRQRLLSQAVKNTLNGLVEKEGLQPLKGGTATEAVSDLSKQFLTRAKATYKTIDDAVGGELQPVLDKIGDLSKAVKVNRSLDPDKADDLLTQRDELVKLRDTLLQKAQANGVSDADGLLRKANTDYMRHKALDEHVGKQIKTAAGEVMRGGHPDPTSFGKAVDRLNNSGKLQRAVGGDTAENLKGVAADAVNNEARSKAAIKVLKAGAKTVGGAALVYGGFKGAKSLSGEDHED